MKHILFTKELLLLVVALFVMIATSCIKEDLDQCYTLKLKVENIKGDDITEYGWMESTDLYIFDENLNYLEKRRLDKNFIRSRNEIVLDGYTADRSLRIVAWGNVNALGEKQSVSEAQTIEDLKVMLKSQDGLAVTPDSLYYGSEQVLTKAGGVAKETEIVIRPKVGTVTIETRGWQEQLGRMGLRSSADCDFYLNNTLSGFDYRGTQIGDSVYYNPEGAWNESGVEWITPTMQTACPGQDMAVSISANGVSLGSAKVDENGDPIYTSAGENTHLILEWGEGGTLSVRATVRPWGVVEEDIPMH